MTKTNLLKMFELNHNDKKGIQNLDVDALIQEVQQNPHSTERRYNVVNDEQKNPEFINIKMCDDYSPEWFSSSSVEDGRIPSADRCRRGGRCLTCGRRCFRKWLFKTIPITDDDGFVCEGRCLYCRPFESYFPLHRAIVLGLPLCVIDALCCPIALEETCNGVTALHLALRNTSAKEPDASWEVVKLLLEKHPKAARGKGGRRKKTLYALTVEAPLDVLSLLLRSWPDAAKEKDDNGQTMLHYAFTNRLKSNRYNWTHPQVKEILDVISVLLRSCPDAIKERDRFGRTPLYYACAAYRVVPLKAILLLLHTWLETTKENRNSSDLDSMKIYASPEVRDLLCHVSALLNNDVFDPYSNDTVAYFIKIEWWNGVFFAINKHPAITKVFNFHTNIMADLIYMTGKRCSLRTMWKVIINEQDLLRGAES